MSNFVKEDLENILEHTSVAPHGHQILVYAGNTPSDHIAYCVSKSILVEAYSPIAHGAIVENQAIAASAKNYGVSVPQLCICYTLQLGAVSLPKSFGECRDRFGPQRPRFSGHVNRRYGV